MKFPAITKYTKKMPDKNTHGYSKFFLVYIHPDYKEDKGLQAHEEEHVNIWWLISLPSFLLFAILLLTLNLQGDKQFGLFMGMLLSPMFPGLLTTLSSKFRLWSEVRCYAVQALHSPQHIEHFGRFIADYYDIKITKEEAVELIKARLRKIKK